MSNELLDELLKSMPKIAEAVNAFKSEQVQLLAFKMLTVDLDFTKLKNIDDTNNAENEDNNNPKKNAAVVTNNLSTQTNPKEIPGIALLEQDGSIRFTMRDIKAKNAVDAGLRLCLIAALVNEKFTGAEELNRQKILKPLLENWRVYNGNTRHAISEHRGIINTKSTIKLDTHAKQEAGKIIQEILDEKIEGKWTPSNVSRKITKKVKNDN